AQKRDSPRARADQVLCGYISCPTIVDSYQVVFASLGIWQEAAVKQNDGNFCAIEGGEDAPVYLVLGRRKFERRKEHARDLLGDVLLAQLLSDQLLGLALGRCRTPEQ